MELTMANPPVLRQINKKVKQYSTRDIGLVEYFTPVFERVSKGKDKPGAVYFIKPP